MELPNVGSGFSCASLGAKISALRQAVGPNDGKGRHGAAPWRRPSAARRLRLDVSKNVEDCTVFKGWGIRDIHDDPLHR